MFKWLLTSAVVASLATSVMGASVTLTSIQDTSIYQESGSLSNGSGTEMLAGKAGAMNGNNLRRALLEFDIAGNIPAGATITGATLTLTSSVAGGNSNAFTFTLSRVLNSWGEGASVAATASLGSGAAAQTGDATWVYRSYNTTSWTTAGSDFSPTVSASASVTGVGAYQWSGAGVVADVQYWLNNPGSDFGWLLRGNESGTNSVKRFDTREDATAGERPSLSIQYTIPEPASLTLLGAAGVVMIRRRRR